jgi:hypothetical protein
LSSGEGLELDLKVDCVLIEPSASTVRAEGDGKKDARRRMDLQTESESERRKEWRGGVDGKPRDKFQSHQKHWRHLL